MGRRCGLDPQRALQTGYDAEPAEPEGLRKESQRRWSEILIDLYCINIALHGVSFLFVASTPPETLLRA